MYHGIKQDGENTACQNMRKKEYNQFFLIKIILKNLVGNVRNASSTCQQYMNGRYCDVFGHMKI